MNREIINKVLMYIDQHITEKISLRELANLAGYSPFYFSTLFSETVGISVTSYIRIRKLQYAMEALLKGAKVVDVSFQYAFESHEGFTRSFTKLFGSSPKTVKKYLKTYMVPAYVVPDILPRKECTIMEDYKNLAEDMYKIPLAFFNESLKEWEAGHCTKLQMELLSDNFVRISDNGRGIPLGDNSAKNQELFDKILAGQPITKLEYTYMESFAQINLQAANSLCEKLQLTVYRNGKSYQQNFIRGIAQHDIVCKESSYESGMEVFLKPDTEIFGNLTFDNSRVNISKSK